MNATITTASVFVERRVRPAPHQLAVVREHDQEDERDGSSTVASTFALSAIESSGAPGIRMIAAATQRRGDVRGVEDQRRGGRRRVEAVRHPEALADCVAGACRDRQDRDRARLDQSEREDRRDGGRRPRAQRRREAGTGEPLRCPRRHGRTAGAGDQRAAPKTAASAAPTIVS